MSSAMRVGRSLRVAAGWRKSSRMWWTSCVKGTVVAEGDACQNASWRREKSPLAPGRPMAIKRSSPRTSCQVLSGIDRAVGFVSVRMECSRSLRRGVKAIVPATESMFQPSIHFRVDQVASPLRSFFTETGSWQVGLLEGASGWKTLSREWNSARLTRRRVAGLPRARPRKSSTQMSHCCTGR